MESIVDNIPKNTNPIDFDLTTAAVLIGLGAEDYVELFRKHNIGQAALKELGDEDLIKIGIKDSSLRQKIIQEASNLPINDDITSRILESELNAIEITQLLNESGKHLHRIHISLLANKTALKKNKEIFDTALHYDAYGCDLSLKAIKEIEYLLNSMESSLDRNFSSLKLFTVTHERVTVDTGAGLQWIEWDTLNYGN